MDKNIILLEFLFICSLLVNLFFTSNLFTKILFVALYILFVFLYKQEYSFIEKKYTYITLGLASILVLSIILYYFPNLTWQVIVICYTILFFYLFKILFNRTYGKIQYKRKTKYKIKIKDIFYKYNKTITLKSRKKLKKGNLVYISLSKLPFNKKPIKILKRIEVKDDK